MYDSYKHNIGEITVSGNTITPRMIEGIKARMLELRGIYVE